MGALGANPPAEPMLPPRYEIVRWLATGGMASVWCADDKLLGRHVAVKVLSERYARDPAAVRRFKREARAAARLSGHPHVVSIYDVGETMTGDWDDSAPRPFIVMEHLAGGTVADALRVHAVDREHALGWIHQAAAALDYAHAHAVVHRDIKPANLLLDCGHSLHVGDFGIARFGTEDTLTREILGTAAYISPEQALGHPATDASDRYSLAVVAYELLVGERPFTAEGVAVQARQHIEERPPPASRRRGGLPRAVDGVLARGMAKEPGRRWATATAFADALDRASSRSTIHRHAVVLAPGRPAHPRVASTTTASRSSTGIRARRAGALAALAAGALGIGLAAAASRPQAPVAGHSTVLISRRPGVIRRASPHPALPGRARAGARVGRARARTATATPAASTTPPPAADVLEARGHTLMQEGEYAAAIPVLQQAIAAAAPGSLTYAYALFDLGRSLRLAGDPQAAIPILWRRLRIPNATDVVRTELELALRAIGVREMHRRQAGQGPPGHEHGRGGGHDHSDGTSQDD